MSGYKTECTVCGGGSGQEKACECSKRLPMNQQLIIDCAKEAIKHTFPFLEEIADFSEEDIKLYSKFAELILQANKQDTERLDNLEMFATKGMGWKVRQSCTGRGLRLHQDPEFPLNTVREALDAFSKE